MGITVARKANMKPFTIFTPVLQDQTGDQPNSKNPLNAPPVIAANRPRSAQPRRPQSSAPRKVNAGGAPPTKLHGARANAGVTDSDYFNQVSK